MARRRFSTENEEAPKIKMNRETLKEALKIFQFIRPYRWYLLGGLSLLALSSLLFMVFLYLPGFMVDVAKGNSSSGYTLNQIGLFLLFILIFYSIVSFFRVFFFAIVSEKGIADVRKAVYSKLIVSPIIFFEENRIGELISRITADVERLFSAFSITLAEFIRQLIVLTAAVIYLAVTTWELALIMLATLPLIVIGALFFGRYIRKLSKKRQAALGDTNTILSETLQSIESVKSFSNEWFELDRYNTSVSKAVKIALNYAISRAGFVVFIIAVLFGALFFIIWNGAQMVQSGEITTGQLINFLSFTAAIGASIAGLGNFYTELLGAIGATERIREILNNEQELNLRSPEETPPIPLKGDIEFQQVKFSYPTRKDIQVLKGVNLRIRSGQKVALVGASGAGKSTIIQLLLRLYKAEEGEILIDGQNVNIFDLAAYRQNFSLVPQEVLLFGGTIRENILYGKPEASEEEVIEAAQKSNCWEFIQSFPEGLDTIVGERGVKLSGGQRQRVAIARAILKNPSILLLDEATSSLDAQSEKVVQEALEELMKGRTSVIIAHRLSTIKNVDCIFVLDRGKIVEMGTHSDLSEIENGAYSNLAKLQFELH